MTARGFKCHQKLKRNGWRPEERERERQREREQQVCVCVCVRERGEREREREQQVCVCVCERERERVNAYLTAKVILRRDVIRQITSKSQGTCYVEGLRGTGKYGVKMKREGGYPGSVASMQGYIATYSGRIRGRVPLLACSYGQRRP